MSTKTSEVKKTKKARTKRSLKSKHVGLRDRRIEGTTLDTLYIIDDSENQVTLEVNAGDEGQTSDMSIKLEDVSIAEGHSGDFPETSLGANNQLNGKKLSIVATISDTSRDTNLTSLTITLRGGFNPQVFELSKTVTEEGESADYLCLIEFFKP
jgi:hypothetical protein